MENHIINFSYDIPGVIIGTEKDENKLLRKDLVRDLYKSGVIDLDHTFVMRGGLAPREVKVVCIVESTIVFASHKSIDEIADVLKKYSKRLYYVLTEVQEQPDTYLARIRANQEQQDFFEKELGEILSEKE